MPAARRVRGSFEQVCGKRPERPLAVGSTRAHSTPSTDKVIRSVKQMNRYKHFITFSIHNSEKASRENALKKCVNSNEILGIPRVLFLLNNFTIYNIVICQQISCLIKIFIYQEFISQL